MINLNIKYSPEYEIERIKNTIKKIAWYKEKGYKLRFPKDFSIEDLNFKNEEYIKASVLNEYEEEVYSKQKKFIEDNFEKINTALQKFFDTTKIIPQENYEVFLTAYGVGGSYNLPNKIIINIQTRKEEKLIETIIHEIIHLSIEELIQKYEIGHWEKERVVYLIFEKTAPELNIKQRAQIDTKIIDKKFEENYPNIEKILEEIKN